MATIEAARKALKRVFGFDNFRPFQEQVIKSVLAGNDTLAVSSTGSGKSLLFQVPAMVMDGAVVVISPLIALMKEQAAKMKALGIRAHAFTGDADRVSAKDSLHNLPNLDLIYVSPEKLRTKEFRSALKRVHVSVFAVDETHVLSTWSGFRASYSSLTDIFEEFPDAVRLACSATADVQIEADVMRIIKLRTPQRFVSSPWRDNIAWQFHRNATEGHLIEAVEAAKGSQIVYASSRREVETLADILNASGITASYYHAGMDAKLRTEAQRVFMENDICMVATSAFGMGVDKGNIRLVANWQLPSSLFDLMQQCGRASRDGKPALAWVRLGDKADRAQRFFIQVGNPKLRVYQRLWKAFSANARPMKWSRDTLLRVGGIPDDVWAGMLDAAVAYLEFTGHLEVTACGHVYRLPIINKSKAIRAVAGIPGARVVQGSVIYEVPPGATDQHARLVAPGVCTYMPPSPASVIAPLVSRLRITDEELDEKRNRAEDNLDAIYRFAHAGNRKAFVEKMFLH